jgi:DNA-directed RNA polymerase specialized sigma subunit
MKEKGAWASVKLSEADIKGILAAAKEGSLTQRQIAEIYRISQAYVSRIVAGKASRVVAA